MTPGRNTRAKRRYAPRLPLAQRREQLMDIAMRMIAESGFASVSVMAVTRRAEVTRPVFYDTFPSVDDLLHALLEREGRRVADQIDSVFPPEIAERTEDFDLDVIIGNFLALVVRHPDTWRLVFSAGEGLPRDVREWIAGNREAVRVRLAALQARLAATGQVPADLDIEVASHLVIGFAEMVSRLVLEDPGRYPPDRIVDFYTTTIRAAGRMLVENPGGP
ncbi:TetR/AcrR family transcriptional regulator [Nocardia wallacei]|uniref:TetR/AcrR family transcriptional regulator n=1 Tax=Nocardia wallacei TaxID=480035 RepID=UPI00245848AB|nr:TetR/AcrR family transcriptional regulator [Nocardia wallacei]